MKKSTVFAAFALSCSVALAAPSESECAVTGAIDSPVATFVKLPLILANPAYAFVFAANSYRQSQCPRPELITREQAQQMIEAAVAQAVQAAVIQAGCVGEACPKTMTASNEGAE